MKLGPERTDRGKFNGFGFAPPQGPRASAKPGSVVARAAPGGVAALFRDSLEDDDGARGKKSGAPCWSKPTVEALQAQRQAEELQAIDPTVFQYDEVIDDVKRDLDVESTAQVLRTDALEQKKRVGLTVLQGSESVRSGARRDAKYIEKVIVAVDRRKVEQQIVEDRLLKKEQNAREGRETFVTSGFKEELKRRSKFEEELAEQEFRDSQKDAMKQEDGKGFADMYRNLLNGGLASSRGGEKVREKAAPRVDEVKEEEDDKEVKLEPKVEVKEEAIKAEPSNGVEDVTASSGSMEDPSAKAARLVAESEQRAEKTMSAKERYLARKRLASTMEND